MPKGAWRCRLEGCVKPGLGRNICLFWDPPVRAGWGTGVADGRPTERPAGSTPPPGTPASPGGPPSDGWAARRDPKPKSGVFYWAGLEYKVGSAAGFLKVFFSNFDIL